MAVQSSTNDWPLYNNQQSDLKIKKCGNKIMKRMTMATKWAKAGQKLVIKFDFYGSQYITISSKIC